MIQRVEVQAPRNESEDQSFAVPTYWQAARWPIHLHTPKSPRRSLLLALLGYAQVLQPKSGLIDMYKPLQPLWLYEGGHCLMQ